MLTDTQKALVQESFAAVIPIADDAAVLFYRRLFELDPSLHLLPLWQTSQDRDQSTEPPCTR